jgi:hypothetical protein
MFEKTSVADKIRRAAILRSFECRQPQAARTEKASADADVVPVARARWGDPAWIGSAEETAWWVRANRLEQERAAKLDLV